VQHDRTRQIITSLGDVKDDVLSLRDDLWLEIDHTDPESIREGTERVIPVVETVREFQMIAEKLGQMLEAFAEPEVPIAAEAGEDEKTKELARFKNREEVTLDDGWSYKRPYGFILRGTPYTYLTTWIELYVKLCAVLRELDPNGFDGVPDRYEIVSTHRYPYFARDPSKLRSARKISETVYAEGHLSANLIRDNIGRLLKILGFKREELQVYLRSY